jgi:hypothetical protein
VTSVLAEECIVNLEPRASRVDQGLQWGWFVVYVVLGTQLWEVLGLVVVTISENFSRGEVRMFVRSSHCFSFLPHLQSDLRSKSKPVSEYTIPIRYVVIWIY